MPKGSPAELGRDPPPPVLFLALLLAWALLLSAGWLLLDRGLTARVRSSTSNR